MVLCGGGERFVVVATHCDGRLMVVAPFDGGRLVVGAPFGAK